VSPFYEDLSEVEDDEKGSGLDPEPDDESPQCLSCGCTDDNACEGGCVWATPTLCSRCVR